MHNDALETPYQLLSPAGQPIGPLPADLDDSRMLGWYRMMWITRTFSNKIIALQRQGRASTWGSLQGQEASAVGMAAPLQPQDWIAGFYRDAGAYFTKGMLPAALVYYTRGYPVPPELHGPEVRCLPIQIVIGTQTLHAVGLAMAAKIKGENSVVVSGCGDGATSEGDFNEALNFAGVYKAPVVMFVTNNGWAISTPRQRQSAAQHLALRGAGFGVPARIVDGNDILAVYAVMREAVERARAGDGPTLVETITYRMGAHTTADDPTRYRPAHELDEWQAKDPITRFRQFLMDRNVLSEAEDQRLLEEVGTYIEEQVKIAHEYPVPGPEGVFQYVYEKLTPRMQRQLAQLQAEAKLQ